MHWTVSLLRQEKITSRATRVLVLSDQQRSWRHACIVLDKTMELLVLRYPLSHVVGSDIALAVGQGAKVTVISWAIYVLGTFSESCQGKKFTLCKHCRNICISSSQITCCYVTEFFPQPYVHNSWTSVLGIDTELCRSSLLIGNTWTCVRRSWIWVVLSCQTL